MHSSVNSYAAAAKFNTQNDLQHSSFNGNHGMDFNLGSSKLTLNDFITQPDLLENLKKNEKEVQFLQNVHFPEKNSSHMQLGKSASYSNYAHLLPPNMSFYDMANKPRELQYKWFLKLSEQFGLEEADKFVELLKQVPVTSGSMMNGKPNMMNGYEEDLSKNFMHLMGNNESLLKVSYNDQKFPSNDVDPFYNPQQSYDNLLGPSPKEQDMKQNSALLGSLFTGPSGSSANSERNILNGIDIFNIPSKAIDLDLDNDSPQRSVPLYMRASRNPK